METMTFQQRYQEYLTAVEDYLAAQFTDKPHWADLYDSMRYSLLAGGKRLRPVMVLEFTRLAGGDWKAALPAACALEFVHTYSLIHDDLPCMDDDDLRRGKPTNHKVYGETMAVLAGDALQPAAFSLILNSDLPAEARLECARILAKAAGPEGMVAGQVLDTLHAPADMTSLRETHALKTGAMIAAACGMGCACGGADAAMRKGAQTYAENLGLAFQVRDDMLDVCGDEATFGKPIGSDREEGKVTFVDLLGLEECGRLVRECTDSAIAAVGGFDTDHFLRELADSLVNRNK